MVDFAVQKALHDLRQSLLYGFWIVQSYAFEPALADTLRNSLGVALVLAMMISAEPQPEAGWALAAGAVFLPVFAFGCIDDAHRFLRSGLSDTPLPLPFANHSGSVASRVFGRISWRMKDLDLSRMELICFRARFMMFEFAEARKERCHMMDVENLRFVLRHESLRPVGAFTLRKGDGKVKAKRCECHIQEFRPREGKLLRSVVPSFPTEGKLGQPQPWQRMQKEKLGQPPGPGLSLPPAIWS